MTGWVEYISCTVTTARAPALLKTAIQYWSDPLPKKKITFYILCSTWTCFPLRMAEHQSWSQKPIFRGSDHEMNISTTRNSGLSKFVNRCLKVWQIVHERFYPSSIYDHKTEFGTGTLENHICWLIFITIGIDIDNCSSKWKWAFFCSTLNNKKHFHFGRG